MTATIDLPSVSVRGVFSFPRARLIWRKGVLRVFTKDGAMLDIISPPPQRRAGYLATWDAETSLGSITIKGRCMTCGGPSWWRVLRKSADELWNMTDE